jgi:hypothetical protein
MGLFIPHCTYCWIGLDHNPVAASAHELQCIQRPRCSNDNSGFRTHMLNGYLSVIFHSDPQRFYSLTSEVLPVSRGLHRSVEKESVPVNYERPPLLNADT